MTKIYNITPKIAEQALNDTNSLIMRLRKMPCNAISAVKLIDEDNKDINGTTAILRLAHVLKIIGEGMQQWEEGQKREHEHINRG